MTDFATRMRIQRQPIMDAPEAAPRKHAEGISFRDKLRARMGKPPYAPTREQIEHSLRPVIKAPTN